MEKVKRVVISVLLWLFVAFSLILAIGMPFGVGTILMLLAAIMAAPLTPIQKVWSIILDILPQKKKKLFESKKKHAEKKKTNAKTTKALIIAMVFLFGFVFGMAATETPEQIDTDTPGYTTEAPDDITTSTTTNGTETTPEATTESTVEATTEPTTEQATDPTTTPTTQPEVIPENSTFEIHFIDVGQADAALVLCDGKAMLIDGGNAEDSSLLYTYLKNHGISHLDYVIGTHAHEDHIGGIAGALNYATVDVAYCPVTSYDTKAFGNFVKALEKHEVSITVPSVGDSFDLGSASCSVLAVNTDSSDPNNTSIVLRIVYGDTSFLFTGDAEREVEQAILKRGTNINSTVLKVGHHGSESSSSYVWLREIMPQYAVISVGKDNSYGHPTEDVLSRLRDAEITTFRTDIQGDIICVSDGKSVTFTVERNADADTLADAGAGSGQTNEPTVTVPNETGSGNQGTDYVGNKNTKKFHYDWCSSVDKMKESNKYYYTGTREEMIAKGYEPCGNCHP